MKDETRVRVVESYTAAHPNPPKARSGDLLTLGRRDEEWPGWVWCTSADGKGSWVPESYLRVEGEVGTLLRDYDATELTVAVGDELTVIEEESGWLWCLTEDGRRGWVPQKNVESAPGSH